MELKHSYLVLQLITLALELGTCLGVTVLETLVHRVHDVLQLVHLALMLGADQRPLRLELVDQRVLLLTELQPQLLNALSLQIYSQKPTSKLFLNKLKR